MSLRERRRSDQNAQPVPAPGSGGGGYAAGYAGGYSGYSTSAPNLNAANGGYGCGAQQQPQAQAQGHYGGYPPSTASAASLGVSSGADAAGYGSYVRSPSAGAAPNSGGGGYAQYGYGGGGGAANNLSGDETKNRKRRSSRRMLSAAAGRYTSVWWFSAVGLTILIFCLTWAIIHYRSQYHSHKEMHEERIGQHHENIHQHFNEKTKALSELKAKKKHVQFLEDRVGDLSKDLETTKSDLSHHINSEKELETRMKKREEILRGQLVNLQTRVARESHRAIIDRFGPGPHQVELQFQLPADPTNYPDVPENPTIIINLYTDAMPHSVHLFLEQVSHKLWDQCKFVLNPVHVFQAAVHHGTIGHSHFQNFVDKELDILSYQEYSPGHPHEKYTVGFAGRPGGTDFYVNKMNNTVANGPGGQEHHELDEEADPCFGKVDESSIPVLERLWELPAKDVHGPSDLVLVDPLTILQARILGWTDPDELAEASEKREEGRMLGNLDKLSWAELAQLCQKKGLATDERNEVMVADLKKLQEYEAAVSTYSSNMKNRNWRSLLPKAREAAIELGYTEEIWDGKGDVNKLAIEDMDWNDLSHAQQVLWKVLGYDEASWNSPETTTPNAEEKKKMNDAMKKAET